MDATDIAKGSYIDERLRVSLQPPKEHNLADEFHRRESSEQPKRPIGFASWEEFESQKE